MTFLVTEIRFQGSGRDFVELVIPTADFAGASPNVELNQIRIAVYNSNGRVQGDTQRLSNVISETDTFTGEDGVAYTLFVVEISSSQGFGGGLGSNQGIAIQDRSGGSEQKLDFFTFGNTIIEGREGIANNDESRTLGSPDGGNDSFQSRDGFNFFSERNTRGEADIVCFTRDTLIEAQHGPVPVQDIRVGDRVETMDHGLQKVAWVGSRLIGRRELRRNPKLYPVRFRAGVLGRNAPKAELLLSPQHRLLIKSEIAEGMFGLSEVLVPAIKLTELPGVFVDDSVDEAEYFHLLFDRHEIVFANGTPAESLLLGTQALKSLPPEALEEIHTIYPETQEPGFRPEPARFIPPGRQQKDLVARHRKMVDNA